MVNNTFSFPNNRFVTILRSTMMLGIVMFLVSWSGVIAQTNQLRLRLDWVQSETTVDTVLREIPVHNILEPDWDDSAIVIHHSVLRVPDGWLDTAYQPYKYVMCYTPFRSNSDENPHLAFSNDGNSWSEALVRNDGGVDSIPNPLWSPRSMENFVFWQTNEIIHLSDPDIMFDANSVLWLVFRVKVLDSIVRSKYQIVITTTADNGLTWTTPKIVINTDRGDPVKGGMWSPAIWQEQLGRYRMLGVYTNAYGPGALDTVNRVALWSCADSTPDGIWVEDTVLYDFMPMDTASRDWWHPEVLQRGNELVLLMTTTKARADGELTALFLATSVDEGVNWDTAGVVFEGQQFPWTNVPFAYRAGGLLSTNDSADVIDFWLSGKDTTIHLGERVRTGRARLTFTPPCDTVLVCPPCCIIAGDVDGDGMFTISDVSFSIAHIFTGGPPPPCQDAADANGDNLFNITDITYSIARIFTGGPELSCGTTYQ